MNTMMANEERAAVDVAVKLEIMESEDDYNAMSLLELAESVQSDELTLAEVESQFTSTQNSELACRICLCIVPRPAMFGHLKAAHNFRRIKFWCHGCSHELENRIALRQHRANCKPTPRRERITFRRLISELEGLDGDTTITCCPICTREFARCELKDHLIAEHSTPDSIAACPLCDPPKMFKSRLTLREHVKLVHQAVEDSEQCDQCGQKFRSQKYLANHKRNVHPSGNKIHKCDTCGKIFKSHLCLYQHTKYVHPPESATVACPHCPHKLFKSKINLQQHLKVAHGRRKDKN